MGRASEISRVQPLPLSQMEKLRPEWGKEGGTCCSRACPQPVLRPTHSLPGSVLARVEEGAAWSLIPGEGGGPSSARTEVGAGATATRHQR